MACPPRCSITLRATWWIPTWANYPAPAWPGASSASTQLTSGQPQGQNKAQKTGGAQTRQRQRQAPAEGGIPGSVSGQPFHNQGIGGKGRPEGGNTPTRYHGDGQAELSCGWPQRAQNTADQGGNNNRVHTRQPGGKEHPGHTGCQYAP